MGTLDDTKQPDAEQERKAEEVPEAQRSERAKKRHQWIFTGVFLSILLGIVLPPLFSWQFQMQQKTLSLANMRRIANGIQLYAQDWDEHLMPPSERLPDGTLWPWTRLARPYVSPDSVFSNPSNPVMPFKSKLRCATEERLVDTSYALNRRFWNTFSPGPFPFENLELPAQTVLLMEAGHMAANPRSPRLPTPDAPGFALDTYGDTTDRFRGLSPYPSVHDGYMDVVAADGHGVSVKVLYYYPSDGPHDPLYGRVAESIYNWNGGHPNGQTDTPPRE